MNVLCFKLNRVYLDRLSMSNAGDLSCMELNSSVYYPGSKRERRIRRRISSSSAIKRRIWRFRVVVEQWPSKKCTKKRDARAELLFC